MDIQRSAERRGRLAAPKPDLWRRSWLSSACRGWSSALTGRAGAFRLHAKRERTGAASTVMVSATPVDPAMALGGEYAAVSPSLSMTVIRAWLIDELVVAVVAVRYRRGGARPGHAAPEGDRSGWSGVPLGIGIHSAPRVPRRTRRSPRRDTAPRRASV